MISLRPINMKDVDNLMTWVNDPLVVGKFATFQQDYTKEDEIAYINKVIQSKDEKVFSIESSGEYIGQAGLHEIEERNKKARLSLLIKREFHSKGYGQESLIELLRTAFSVYSLHRVWLIVDKENQKARHIYEKLGFTKEGIEREAYFRDGIYRDMVKMSMLDREFRY